MKFVKMLLIILCAVSLIGFGACEKSGTTDPNGDNPYGNSLTVTISGDFALNYVAAGSASVVSATDMGFSGTMTVGTATYTITIVVNSPPGTGSFPFTDAGDSNPTGKGQGIIAVNDTQTGLTSYWIETGNITVTSISDARLKGTFNFAAIGGATGTAVISGASGQFDLIRINI